MNDEEIFNKEFKNEMAGNFKSIFKSLNKNKKDNLNLKQKTFLRKKSKKRFLSKTKPLYSSHKEFFDTELQKIKKGFKKIEFLDINVKSKPILQKFKSEKNLLKIKENKWSEKTLLTAISTKDERSSVYRVNSNYRMLSGFKKKRNSGNLKPKKFILKGQKYKLKRPQSVNVLNKFFNQSGRKIKKISEYSLNKSIHKERKERPTTALNFK